MLVSLCNITNKNIREKKALLYIHAFHFLQFNLRTIYLMQPVGGAKLKTYFDSI